MHRDTDRGSVGAPGGEPLGNVLLHVQSRSKQKTASAPTASLPHKLCRDACPGPAWLSLFQRLPARLQSINVPLVNCGKGPSKFVYVAREEIVEKQIRRHVGQSSEVACGDLGWTQAEGIGSYLHGFNIEISLCNLCPCIEA